MYGACVFVPQNTTYNTDDAFKKERCMFFQQKLYRRGAFFLLLTDIFVNIE